MRAIVATTYCRRCYCGCFTGGIKLSRDTLSDDSPNLAPVFWLPDFSHRSLSDNFRHTRADVSSVSNEPQTREVLADAEDCIKDSGIR